MQADPTRNQPEPYRHESANVEETSQCYKNSLSHRYLAVGRKYRPSMRRSKRQVAATRSSFGMVRQSLRASNAKLRKTTPPARSSATSQPEEVRLGSKAWCHSSRIAVIRVMFIASSVQRIRIERNALGEEELSEDARRIRECETNVWNQARNIKRHRIP